MVTENDIINAIDSLGLSNKSICVHCSLKSFGYVNGGAKTIITPFLDKGCTIMVPTFTFDFALYPFDKSPYERNAIAGSEASQESEDSDAIYSIKSNHISKSMGAFPSEVLKMDKRVRGNNPLNSFAAIGQKAEELISSQSAINVYAPFKKLYEDNGYVLLMGVDYRKMTAIHYAEKEAGRTLFRRWANDEDGKLVEVAVGSCSDGFNNFALSLDKVGKDIIVGDSLWRLFPIRDVIDICSAVICENQNITHCANENCIHCNDAVQGGPIV